MRIAIGILLGVVTQIFHRNSPLLDTVITCATSPGTGIKRAVCALVRVKYHLQACICLVVRIVELPRHQVTSPTVCTGFIFKVLSKGDTVGRESIEEIFIAGKLATRNSPHRLIVHFIDKDILIIIRQFVAHRLHTLGIRQSLVILMVIHICLHQQHGGKPLVHTPPIARTVGLVIEVWKRFLQIAHHPVEIGLFRGTWRITDIAQFFRFEYTRYRTVQVIETEHQPCTQCLRLGYLGSLCRFGQTTHLLQLVENEGASRNVTANGISHERVPGTCPVEIV